MAQALLAARHTPVCPPHPWLGGIGCPVLLASWRGYACFPSLFLQGPGGPCWPCPALPIHSDGSSLRARDTRAPGQPHATACRAGETGAPTVTPCVRPVAHLPLGHVAEDPATLEPVSAPRRCIATRTA